MERLLLRFLLNYGLFINAIAFFFGSNYKDDLPTGFYLPGYVIPEHYNIQLDLTNFNKEKSFDFSGTCKVYIKIIRPTWYISLHAQKPQIEIQEIATLNNVESLELYIPTNVTYNKETHILIFHFDYELSNGYYFLNMSFIGSSDNNGNSFFTTIYENSRTTNNKIWFVTTQFKPIGARQLFPCWDEPVLKATFNISIIHHVRYVALSNMPRQNVIEDDFHILRTYFKTTPLMSTYLVMFLLYDVFPHTAKTFLQEDSQYKYQEDLQYKYHEETMFASNVTDIIITNFVKKWKYFQNISDVYHIITSENNSQNNNLKIIIPYRAATIFYNKRFDTDMHKIEVAYIIANKLVHQWLDNLISPSWWSDYWFIEGIASLLTMDIINKIFPDFQILDLFVVQTQQESLRLDNYISDIMRPLILHTNKPSEIDSIFSFSHYIKAPVILNMLQNFLTKKVFQKGIKIFLEKHSVILDDFWSAMQIAYNRETPYKEISRNIEKFDIRNVMNTCTKQKHYPKVLKVTQPDLEHFTVSIENIKSLAKDNWIILITVIKQTEPNMTYKQVYYEDMEIETNFILSCKDDEWIIVNSQIGYYHVNYEPKNWLKIAKYLNSANYTKIHVLNRAQIIDDANYFLSIGQLDLNIFLELTKYLSQETDYVAWYPMIKTLEDMSSIFLMLDERVDFIKKNMREILNKVLIQIGYEEHSEDNILTKCLRQELAKWACILKHPNCIKMAKQKLERHIFHSEKLLPWWKQWTYCNGITTEENLNGIWFEILEKWALDSDNRILDFLTCIEHPNPIKEYLNQTFLEVYVNLKKYYLAQENIFIKFKDIDRINKFFYIIKKHAKNNEILDYILQNFEELKPREVNTVAALIIIINNVYSKIQLKKITDFVNKLAKQENIVIKFNNLTTSIFFRNELDKIHEYARNFIQQRISFIHRKIEKRLFEIILILKSNKKEVIKLK